MTDPTNPPTPAEMAAIIAEANRVERLCLCPNVRPVCETVTAGRVCPSFAALIACAERGIAPPSGEVREIVDAIKARQARAPHQDCGKPCCEDHHLLNRATAMLLRLSAPPVAAPSGEALEKAARESETRRAEMERGFKEAQIEGHKYTASKLAAAESRCAALGRALIAAQGLLKKIEWHALPDSDDYACAACGNCKHAGHEPDCELRAALSAEPAKPEMPECVRELVWALKTACHAYRGQDEDICPNCRETIDKVESYYAKPSATAGEGKS